MVFQEWDGQMRAEDEHGTEMDDPSVTWENLKRGILWLSYKFELQVSKATCRWFDGDHWHCSEPPEVQGDLQGKCS